MKLTELTISIETADHLLPIIEAEYKKILDKILKKNQQLISEEWYDYSTEQIEMKLAGKYPAIDLYRKMINELSPREINLPGIDKEYFDQHYNSLTKK